MTDKKSNDSRRKLLKTIAAGSGAVVAGKSLPESWSKPVVDAVMLPAHASTTAAPLPTFLTCVCNGAYSEGQRVEAVVNSGPISVGDKGTVLAGTAGGLDFPSGEGEWVQIEWDVPAVGGASCSLILSPASTCGTCADVDNVWWSRCEQIKAV